MRPCSPLRLGWRAANAPVVPVRPAPPYSLGQPCPCSRFTLRALAGSEYLPSHWESACQGQRGGQDLRRHQRGDDCPALRGWLHHRDLLGAGGLRRFLSIVLEYYFKWNVPWGILSVILTAGAMVMMIRGVGVSTKLAGAFFGFEMLVLVVVSVVVIIQNAGHLSFTPFEPSHLKNGFTGLAAGFPLAIYLFIGWENSAALAEETNNPRRNVPRAIFLSVALMAVGYVLFAYATVTGFGYSAAKVDAATIPFITVAHGALAAFAFFAFFAGMTSTLGALISAVNSQCRLIFNAGREGLLPSWLGKVHPTRRTPVNAIFAFVGIAAAIIVVWALLHLIGGHTGSMNPINFFVESSSLGTILLVVVYFLSNLALPFYYRKIPAGAVQRGQAPHPAGTGDGGHCRAGVLPVQARPVGAVQMVPVRRAGHGDHLCGLRVRAEWPGPVPR